MKPRAEFSGAAVPSRRCTTGAQKGRTNSLRAADLTVGHESISLDVGALREGAVSMETGRGMSELAEEFDEEGSWGCHRPHKALKTTVDFGEMTVLTSARAPYPIVWASEGWLELCGFSATEIVGRDLKLIQGPGTDRLAITKLMDAVRSGSELHELTLVNYTKEKQPFRHTLSMVPLCSEPGEDGQAAAPTTLRATSTNVSYIGAGACRAAERKCAPSRSGERGACVPGGGANNSDREEQCFWGDDLEGFEYAWEQFAVTCSPVSVGWP